MFRTPRIASRPSPQILLRLAVLWMPVMLALSQCAPLPERTRPQCPPPPLPVCTPGHFDRTLLDTMFHDPRIPQPHITALHAPANSTSDDVALCAVPEPAGSGTLLIVTTDREAPATSSGQHMIAMHMLSTTDAAQPIVVTSDGGPITMGTPFYCAADQRLYFSRRADGRDADDHDLYSAALSMQAGDVHLKDIRPLTALNEKGTFESQPTLDPTGRTIYFVSDRSGGLGGTDIWVSHRSSAQSNDWSAPEDLGAPINTACDELSPHISGAAPNTFYFASNGHETVGGYDLFKATIKDGKIGEPENLGRPINTEADEVSPTLLNDTAFFWSSNRAGGPSGMDLYTITRTTFVLAHRLETVALNDRPVVEHLATDTAAPVKPDAPVLLRAHVDSAIAKKKADLFVMMGDTEVFRKRLPASGDLTVELRRDTSYEIGAETEDAFYDLQHISTRGTLPPVIKMALELPDTLVVRINFPFDDHEHPYKYVIDDRGEPGQMSWSASLDLAARSVLRSVGRMKQLILIGHTDSLGTDPYNERLGRLRAEFVAHELESRGVPHGLIQIESRGRTTPVAPHDGEGDDRFRMRSRRVEFIKVLK